MGEDQTGSFIDEAVIQVFAGKGGAGASRFRREKFVPLGGPDGGDGGAGGSVILAADSNARTLLDYRFNRVIRAEDGAGGSGNNRTGKSGSDIVLKVPVGTQIVQAETGDLVADLDTADTTTVIARGGRGGKGNAFFKSATRQSPQHSQPGEPGEQGKYVLSLKLVADVGLIGLPNAGKSTLISRISAARPKIADYPFTTLVPNLGVVQGTGIQFVMADIPGLIPGAHTGRGLGIKFLKHVERTRVLAHLIDASHALQEPVEKVIDSYDAIRSELVAFSSDLASKPELVVITKTDVIDNDLAHKIMEPFLERGLKCVAVSSATGHGLPGLVHELSGFVTASVR